MEKEEEEEVLAHAEILTGWRSSSKVMSSAAPLGPVVCAQRTCRQAGAQASAQKKRSNQIGTLGALARAHRPLWSQIGSLFAICLLWHTPRSALSAHLLELLRLFCQINRSLLSNQQVSVAHTRAGLSAHLQTHATPSRPQNQRGYFCPPPPPPHRQKY